MYTATSVLTLEDLGLSAPRQSNAPRCRARRRTPNSAYQAADLGDITREMHFRMHDVVSTTDTCGMDVGRYLNISAAPNDGVLSAAAALVVLVVLFWALMPQFWQVTDDLAATAPAHTGSRSHGGPNDATFPIPRTPRVGAY